MNRGTSGAYGFRKQREVSGAWASPTWSTAWCKKPYGRCSSVCTSRRFTLLKAKVVMPDGVVVGTDEGVPQGGPLSPLLSNIVLDELDGELERRGHRFVRYADDCNIYVRSERAGQRVMASVVSFIERRLRLR